MTKSYKEGKPMSIIIAVFVILLGVIGVYYGVSAIVAGIIALLAALGLKRD